MPRSGVDVPGRVELVAQGVGAASVAAASVGAAGVLRAVACVDGVGVLGGARSAAADDQEEDDAGRDRHAE